jgi:alkylation response protein AidB-like acyl-CoA dehydrogenase
VTLVRTLFDDTHEMFRQAFRAFVEKEIEPHHAGWERAGIVDKAMFRKAGSAGFLGIAAPESYGGGGQADFRFNAVMIEEIAAAGVTGSGVCLSLHNDVAFPYFLSAATPEQKARWLSGMCSGELMTAIAMTEPGTGSDLGAITTTAVRDGDHYVLNGSKTFITNGINSDLVIVVCKTDPPARHRGMSLLVVEAGMDGFERGRNLDKIGQHAADTAELFFTDVRVPVANRLGDEGSAFGQLVAGLPQERLAIAVAAVAQAEAAFGWTLDYCRERRAFGQPIGSFQHNRFRLAEMRTELDIARVFVDRQMEAHTRGELSAEDAAKAKWWCTEMQTRLVDTCLQLHGGYGYMEEYPIARAWRDGRVQTIYGGTTEVMKEIVGRALNL